MVIHIGHKVTHTKIKQYFNSFVDFVGFFFSKDI